MKITSGSNGSKVQSGATASCCFSKVQQLLKGLSSEMKRSLMEQLLYVKMDKLQPLYPHAKRYMVI